MKYLPKIAKSGRSRCPFLFRQLREVYHFLFKTRLTGKAVYAQGRVFHTRANTAI